MLSRSTLELLDDLCWSLEIHFIFVISCVDILTSADAPPHV